MRKEHGLVANILGEPRVVDDRLDVRECLIQPSGIDRLRGARHPRSDIIRFEYEDFPELGFRQFGLARLANPAGEVGTVDKLRGIDFGDASVVAGFRGPIAAGRFRSQVRLETAGRARSMNRVTGRDPRALDPKTCAAGSG